MAGFLIKRFLQAVFVVFVVTLTVSYAIRFTGDPALMLAQGAGFGLYASIALILTGMVCTARFMVSDHTTTEIYGGLIIGIVALVVANWAA